MFCQICYTLFTSVPVFRLVIMRCVHIIHQEVLNANSTSLPALFLFPAGGSDIDFFCIVAYDAENVNRF